MKNILIGIFLVLTVIMGTGNIYSQCGTCIDQYFSVYDEFKGSNSVFVGKVVEIKKVEESRNTDTTTNTDYYDFRVKFEVETAWKNDLPKIITITNVGSKSSDFKIGDSYLIYAYFRHYDKKNLRSHTGCCSRTKLLSEAEEDLQEFKDKGEKPTNIITLDKCKNNQNN